MTIIYILVPVALVIVTGALVAFVWAARRGQFDDLTTPALRMLRDDPTGRDQDRHQADPGGGPR
jgi:cbb3-type cytochrome oxidase maturation protein